MKRYALIVTDKPEQIPAYLPGNYRVLHNFRPEEPEAYDDIYTTRIHCHLVVIVGEDSHGWTLDGYVLPRLASGNHIGREVDLSHPYLKRVPA